MITRNKVKYRLINSFERDVFRYLHALRNTGKINVYDAMPYLEERFKISEKNASELLHLWLDNFKEDEKYRFIRDSTENNEQQYNNE